MLLSLFIPLFMIALLLIFLGYYKDNYILQVIGFTFIFMLGFQFYDNGLEYKTGSNYSWNINQSTTGNITTYIMSAIESQTNDTYTNLSISIFLMLVGILGFVSVFFNIKSSLTGK